VILESEFGYDRRTALLASAWAVAVYCFGPYIVLVLIGEQGSGKSTLARLLRMLIDPSTIPTTGPPRESRDVVVAAINRYVVTYDNLSVIPPWLSDELARLATGAGVSQRSLYTNADELARSYRRPVLLNGISSPATAADLLDRSLVLALPTIDATTRKTEAEIDRLVTDLGGEMFGAVLTAISAALQKAGTIEPARWARMVDATTFALAAAEALGTTRNELEQAMRANVASRDRIVLEENAFTDTIVDFMSKREAWSGSCAQLLFALEEHGADPKRLPKTAAAASHELNRSAPVLRRLGIDYRADPDTKKRTKHLRRISTTAEPSAGEIAATSATTATPSSARSGGSADPGTEQSRTTGGVAEAEGDLADDPLLDFDALLNATQYEGGP
jgi:hypothetical protein